MEWYYKYHDRRACLCKGELFHPTNVREIVCAKTKIDAAKQLENIEKRDNKKLCSLLHGPYISREEAETAHTTWALPKKRK